MNKIPQHLHRHDDCLASKGSYLACSNAFHEHNLVKIGKRRVINTFREGSAHDKPCAMFLAFGLLTLHIFIHPCIWGLEIATECDFEWRLLYTHTHTTNQHTHSLIHAGRHPTTWSWDGTSVCAPAMSRVNQPTCGSWDGTSICAPVTSRVNQPTYTHTYIHTYPPRHGVKLPCSDGGWFQGSVAVLDLSICLYE
jgi:hypothetical protein